LFVGLWWWNSKSSNVPLATKPMTLVNAANPVEAATGAQFQKLIALAAAGWRLCPGDQIDRR